MRSIMRRISINLNNECQSKQLAVPERKYLAEFEDWWVAPKQQNDKLNNLYQRFPCPQENR